MLSGKKTSRLILWIALGVMLTIAVIAPLGFFYISYQYMAGSLDSEARLYASALTGIISTNPEMWELEQVRLREILSHRIDKRYAEARRILNLKKEVVAESIDKLEVPVMQRSFELMDSGVVAGTIVIHRSLRPLLTQTLFIGAASMSLGLVAFLFIRILPVRALERKEEALRLSEERMSKAQKMAHVGNWEWNIVENRLYWSDEVYRIYGLDPEHFNPTFEAVEKAMHPDDREPFLKAVHAALYDRGPYKLDYRLIRPDGTVRTVHAIGEVYYDPTGKPLMKSGTVQDITERKMLEEERNRLGELVEASPASITVHDFDGNFLYANQRTYDLYGYTEQEFMALNLRQIDAPESVQLIEQRMREIMERGEASFEVNHFRKDGSMIPMHIIARLSTWGNTGVVQSIATDITDRKKAEEMLHKANEALHALIRYSPLAIICTDLDTKVLIWNPAAERIFGWSEKEVIGRKNPIVPKEKQEEYLKLREAVRSGNPYHATELHRQRKDGTLIYLNAASAALYDNAGNVIALLGIFEDITERKEAQKALSESEARLKKAHQVADLGNWEWNIVTNDLFWSEENYRIFGLDFKSVRPSYEAFINTVDPAEREFVNHAVADAVAGKKPYDIDFTIIRPDNGEKRIIETKADVIFNNEGRAIKMTGTVQDITARKQAEEKIRESEQFIRNILDTVDEGFIVVDRDFRIVIANNAYCSQIGETCSEVVGRHCYEISHKALKPCYEEGEDCAVRHVFVTGEPHTAVHRHTDSRGGILYVETKAFPITDSSGAITSVIETVNNITEKHLLEEERLKTQKLEAIGTLAGGIAHDFNNLLQGVFGYISMAKITHDQKERSLAMLEQAEQALHLSVNLTTQLLTFSKGGKPVKKMMKLQPVIENSVKFALSGSSVDYRIKLDDELWSVEADEGQIGQVMQNIVLNADQAMPLGGMILITAKNVREPKKGIPHLLKEGKYVEISVEDNGIGISQKYLSKIFDPYFTTKEKGSGLGLATSYSIVRNHGGLIDVASEVGRGTTFYIYIPAIEGEKEAPQAPATSPSVRKGKILVMDDEELILHIVGEMIKSLGHEVEFAEHGEAAIEKYRVALDTGNPSDIVILDLTIRGGMGGRDTIERLRAIDPSVRAIVSSGYSDDAVVANYEKYGFKARLTKPYKLEELRDTLNALLSQ